MVLGCPVPPALLVLSCDCGIPTEIKQSRDPETVAQAFYTCRENFAFGKFRCKEPCRFFHWIDGLDKYGPVPILAE